LLHVAALGFTAGFSFLGAFLLFKFTDMLIPLRVTEQEEDMGLDLSQHGESLMDEGHASFGGNSNKTPNAILSVGLSAKSGVSA